MFRALGKCPLANSSSGLTFEHGRSPAAQAVEQLTARNRLEFVASPEIACHHARDFGAVALADAA